jgi:hypothetical protein
MDYGFSQGFFGNFVSFRDGNGGRGINVEVFEKKGLGNGWTVVNTIAFVSVTTCTDFEVEVAVNSVFLVFILNEEKIFFLRIIRLVLYKLFYLSSSVP